MNDIIFPRLRPSCLPRTPPTYPTGLASKLLEVRKPHHCNTSFYWGGRGRTYNLLVNSQALCQLSYAPSILFFPIVTGFSDLK